jgi:hypothetical protein
MQQYFAAVCGQAPYPAVRCNVVDYSAVIGATGRINPCFFISGPPQTSDGDDFERLLNGEAMLTLREDIRNGNRPECARCVCSLWRDPGERRVADFLIRA